MRRLALLAVLVLFTGCSWTSSHHRRVRVVRHAPVHPTSVRVHHVKGHVVTKCGGGYHVRNCGHKIVVVPKHKVVKVKTRHH